MDVARLKHLSTTCQSEQVPSWSEEAITSVGMATRDNCFAQNFVEPYVREGEILKQRLRFFFLNPIEKWRIRRHLPWKLIVQAIKVLLVTIQLYNFGDMRMAHVNFIEESKASLRHIFLPQWSSERDVISYPPNSAPYAIYSLEDFYAHLTYAVVQANFVSLLENRPINCRRSFTVLQVERYDVWKLRIQSTSLARRIYSIRTTCTTLRCYRIAVESVYTTRSGWSENFSIIPLLASKNLTVHRRRFLFVELMFSLKTIHVRRTASSDLPDCFRLDPVIRFDSAMHTGQVLVALSVKAEYVTCKGEMKAPSTSRAYRLFLTTLDVFVLPTCVVSFFLCARALLSAYYLKLDTRRFLKESTGETLGRNDELAFLNGWYILILVNDVCILLGTLLKLDLEFKVFDSALLTATGMLLGVGTFLVWIGLLRYFGFFSQYNIIILTLKRSVPNVMRFLLCAGILYLAFLFCGWIVIGPYNMKFRSLMITSECLFALINGDDMFATFTTTSDQNVAVSWFTRIYLYIFITLFTYVVLSLFISIIMDAYDVIKVSHEQHAPNSILLQFIGSCAASQGGDQFPIRESAVFLRLCRSLRSLFDKRLYERVR
uniref:PKD_channel domain-containing protein n=1 Tax=Trichuris muris TaxID=70415 RepID=A0A5S6Q9T4_TRIMR